MNELFKKPQIIGVVADVNEGKSMLLYHVLHKLNKTHNFSLYTYGLRLTIGDAKQIFSIEEMENIKNSIIVVDELSSLLDLDNRKAKRMIENFLRLINHNNNVLVLCGVPENFKKFISGKIDQFFFKKTSKADLINGSRVKNIIEAYKGVQNGSSVLSLNKDEALYFDGNHYKVVHVPYYKQYDTKKENCAITVPKNVQKGDK